jgi:hypothetical protein
MAIHRPNPKGSDGFGITRLLTIGRLPTASDVSAFMGVQFSLGGGAGDQPVY